jgi:RNA polymerase sigma factor (sigma-70 family)
MAGVSSREVLRHLNTLFHSGPGGSLGDDELLERFIAGRDADAFAALVERHGAMVLGVCRRVLGNRDAAEDAFQATFLVLSRKAASIARREHVFSWLYGVALRAALDARAREMRRKAREKRWGAMRAVESTDPTDTSGLREVLDEELARLPERYRSALVLCELEGLSRRDAAVRLGISEGTLSSRLARAKNQLKDRLTRRGVALSTATLGTFFAREAQAVIVPPALADAAIRLASGPSSTAVVSASVATLTEGVLKAMLLAKFKGVALALVALAVVSTSAVAIAQPGGGSGPNDDRLQSLERKLDRLLDVLGRAVPSPTTGAPTPPTMPPPITIAPVPPVPAPPVAPPGSAYHPAPTPVPVPGPPGSQPNPNMAPPPRVPETETRAVMRRIEFLEHRFNELDHRLNEVERKLNRGGPGGNAILEGPSEVAPITPPAESIRTSR